jgi:glyceraldehyde 3-phosphate dehydrogenase
MTVQAINETLIGESKGALKGVMYAESKELVSVDFNGNPHSSIIDLKSTMTIGSNMGKVFSWYDNETGFSHRMIDMIKHIETAGF